MTLEKDKEDQSKYYLSYPKPPVLDVTWKTVKLMLQNEETFQSFSSTKWRLGGNVALRLMKCLTSSVSFDKITDSYFTSFRLLALLGVNRLKQHEC